MGQHGSNPRPLPAVRADAGAPRRSLNAAAVALSLGIGRSTVYTIGWLMARAFIPVGTRGMRWDESDVELYKSLRQASDVRAAS